MSSTPAEFFQQGTAHAVRGAAQVAAGDGELVEGDIGDRFRIQEALNRPGCGSESALQSVEVEPILVPADHFAIGDEPGGQHFPDDGGNIRER